MYIIYILLWEWVARAQQLNPFFLQTIKRAHIAARLTVKHLQGYFDIFGRVGALVINIEYAGDFNAFDNSNVFEYVKG